MAVREIAFELECFEWADEHLEVAGRWKGVAGRRLDRPVLTVETDGGRRKHLAAMPGGHFGAVEESWRAAFAWPGDPADITGAELEVGGSVVVDLPLPDKRRRRRRRALVDAGDEALRDEVGALHGQVERLRAELAGRERENMRLRAQIEEETGEGDDAAEAGAATVEIERPDLTAELERLTGERDRTRTELSAEVQRLHGELDRTRVELERLRDEGERSQRDVDDLREAFSEAAAEAEESRDRHRADVAALEEELRAERTVVARLTTKLVERPELPPPATGSAQRAAATRSREDTEALPALVDTAAMPGVLDPPGPVRAGARPSVQPGADHGARPSRIPAWLRGGRTRADEPTVAEPGGDEAVSDEAGERRGGLAAADETIADEAGERRGGLPATDEPVSDGPPEHGSADPAAADETVADERSGAAVSDDAVSETRDTEDVDEAAARGDVAAGNGVRDEDVAHERGRPAMASLQALKSRLENLFASNGHATAGNERAPAHEEAIPGPRRSASAARARAGATVAARRSPAELWAARIVAAVVVAVLLLAFVLILTSIA